MPTYQTRRHTMPVPTYVPTTHAYQTRRHTMPVPTYVLLNITNIYIKANVFVSTTEFSWQVFEAEIFITLRSLDNLMKSLHLRTDSSFIPIRYELNILIFNHSLIYIIGVFHLYMYVDRYIFSMKTSHIIDESDGLGMQTDEFLFVLCKGSECPMCNEHFSTQYTNMLLLKHQFNTWAMHYCFCSPVDDRNAQYVLSYLKFIIFPHTKYGREAGVSVNSAFSTLVHALMECRCTSCILRAFRMCGTCKLTASPPLPRIWFCSEDIDPRSVDPTCPVCLKSVGWPIIDRSIRGRLLCSCSCSATQENNWNQNSPAMIRSESIVRLNDTRKSCLSIWIEDVWREVYCIYIYIRLNNIYIYIDIKRRGGLTSRADPWQLLPCWTRPQPCSRLGCLASAQVLIDMLTPVAVALSVG